MMQVAHNRSRAKRILVVEDDRETCKMYQTALESEGFSVDVATTAGEALSKDPDQYDLVIMDVQLEAGAGLSAGVADDRDGNKDGIEITHKFREKGSKTPILVVTIKLAHEIVNDAFNAGANGYIVKPFDLDELFSKIDELI